jgi:hypothetical protein
VAIFLKGRRAVTQLLLVSLVTVSALSAQTSSVSVGGAWRVVAAIAGTHSEQSCSFTQKDADLTGTCQSERGSVTITGKVDGRTVTWQFETEYEGQKLTVVYAGTLDAAEKIAGGVDVRPMDVSGEFTATRSK